MKLLATIHREYDGEPVDFEIYDNGDVFVVDYDIEHDMAAEVLGLDETEVLRDYLKIKETPFYFFADNGLLGPFIRDNAVTTKLVASTAHITKQDDEILEQRAVVNEASGLIYDSIDGGYVFYLESEFSPEETVQENQNKHELSRSLIDALQLAQNHGIYSVEFSSSGRLLDGIEMHDW